MDKLKTIFLVFTFLCFTNIAMAQNSSRPILKIIPAPKNLKDSNICDYLLVVENFSKGELFMVSSERLFFRDFGLFTKNTRSAEFPLFFAIRAKDYHPGHSASFRCVDITKNSGTMIYFTPNPIEEDFSDDEDDDDHELHHDVDYAFENEDVQVENDLKVIVNYYSQMGKEKIYTLQDLEEFRSEGEDVSLNESRVTKIQPPPPISIHSFPSTFNTIVHPNLKK